MLSSSTSPNLISLLPPPPKKKPWFTANQNHFAVNIPSLEEVTHESPPYHQWHLLKPTFTSGNLVVDADTAVSSFVSCLKCLVVHIFLSFLFTDFFFVCIKVSDASRFLGPDWEGKDFIFASYSTATGPNERERNKQGGVLYLFFIVFGYYRMCFFLFFVEISIQAISLTLASVRSHAETIVNYTFQLSVGYLAGSRVGTEWCTMNICHPVDHKSSY